MTLVELLVSTAIAAIFIAGAAAVFAEITRQNTQADRQAAQESDGAMALMLVQRELLNAGYHFPSATYAVRIVNAVDATTLLADDASGTAHKISSGTADDGVIQETDVIEYLTGPVEPTYDAGLLRILGAANNASQMGNTATFTAQSTGAPFMINESAADPVIVLAVGQGGACLGKTSGPGGSGGDGNLAFKMDLLEPDLTAVVTNPVCPTVSAGSVTLYPFGSRTRFLVERDAAGVPGLYVQRNTDGEGTMSASELLVPGIEDMQILPIVRNDAANSLGCGAGQLCWCNAGTDPSCSTWATCDLAATPTVSGGPWQASVVGVQIWLVSRGDEPLRLEGSRLQALCDRGTAGPVDNLARTRRSVSVWFRNATLVTPP
jgi:type II secretory pathway pseudopilin PulG